MLRKDQIAQLELLLDESHAFGPLLAQKAEGLLTAQPLDKWSIKQILGHLVDCDRYVFAPRIRALAEADNLTFERVDQNGMDERGEWNLVPIGDLLEQLEASRSDLLTAFRKIPESAWEHSATFGRGDVWTVGEYAMHIARHDAHHLSQIAYRMLEFSG